MHPYEAILRMCAAAWPNPWYPRVYARSAGVSEDQLHYYLENLWLDGLVQKAESAPGAGPGLTLTEAGREVLEDPAALQRLKEGRAVKKGDPGGVVREAIRLRTTPVATLGIIAANAVAFLYCMYLASKLGILADYVTLSPFGGGNAAVEELVSVVVKQAGGVYGAGWLRGEWWRLLACCFIHIGALHILANMYALYRVGAEVERMWGSVRYLVIYLFAGLGGSVLALGLQPWVVMAGASGAICGVLGAAAVWVLCNGPRLPRSLASQLRRNLLINGVLIVFISLMPGVSWQGHLGGAVVGGAVALVMQLQRFGPSPWRWAVLATLVPLPWLGVAFINHEQTVNPAWVELIFSQRIRLDVTAAYQVYEDEGGVLDQAPEDRQPSQVKRVTQDIEGQRAVLKRLAEDHAKLAPSDDEVTQYERKAADQLIQSLDDLLATAEECLRERAKWTAQDQEEQRQWNQAADDWFRLVR